MQLIDTFTALNGIVTLLLEYTLCYYSRLLSCIFYSVLQPRLLITSTEPQEKKKKENKYIDYGESSNEFGIDLEKSMIDVVQLTSYVL